MARDGNVDTGKKLVEEEVGVAERMWVHAGGEQVRHPHLVLGYECKRS